MLIDGSTYYYLWSILARMLNLNLIKPLDVNTSLQKIQGTGKHIKENQGDELLKIKAVDRNYREMNWQVHLMEKRWNRKPIV